MSTHLTIKNEKSPQPENHDAREEKKKGKKEEKEAFLALENKYDLCCDVTTF